MSSNPLRNEIRAPSHAHINNGGTLDKINTGQFAQDQTPCGLGQFPPEGKATV